MITKLIEVTQHIAVTIDETQFTEEFLAEFDRYFYDFDGDLDEHFKHLAQLYARGVYDETDYIEGYGPAKSMGIKFERRHGGEEILPDESD